MISVADALACVCEAAPVLGGERVVLPDALGRAAAEEVRSTRAVPAAANSAMDGYAVRHADLAPGCRLRIVGTAPAGPPPPLVVGPGTAVKIFTGSVIPPGADTVVKVEDTDQHDGTVVVRTPPSPRANVRDAGEDVRPGQTVVAAGTVLGPADLGILASVGRATVLVHRRPQVAIVSTGSELVEVDQEPGPGQVVNSNAYTLAAAAREAGADAVVLPIAPDRADEIEAVLRQATARADVVLSSGGVSVGELDFVKQVLDGLAVERLFWKVAQKPGKPLAFGRLGGRLFFGLPGNPVSALVCFYVYVRPALRRMAGHRRLHLPWIEARLARPVRKASGLTEFVRVQLTDGDDGPVATAVGSQSSGVLSGLGGGAGLLVGPASLGELAAGARYPVIVPGETSLARLMAPF